jgi:zinc and cadmium transporter
MTLLWIILGTAAAGVGSVLLAAWLTFGVLSRYTQHLLSLAAGALLATAFMHLLPHAFESQAGAKELFATLLGCVVFFFLLDKAELYHHGHEHHHGLDHGHEHQHEAHADHSDHAGHHHAPATAATPAPSHTHTHAHAHPPRAGGWAVLMGDSVHCFGDGVLIASAFIADVKLGILAAIAVLAHEVPHHMGDMIVLRQTERGFNPALIKLCLAGGVTVIGGVVGFSLVAQIEDLLPYMLVVASGSFLYVALADLIPQLQTRLSLKATGAQIAWLAVGVLLVTLVSGLAHGH